MCGDELRHQYEKKRHSGELLVPPVAVYHQPLAAAVKTIVS